MSSLLVFNIIYRVEIQSVMLVLQALWTIAPLTFSLVSSPPLPCVNKYTVLYINCTSIQWVRGGGFGVIGGEGASTDKTCRKVHLQVNFLDNHIWDCYLSLIFLWIKINNDMQHRNAYSGALCTKITRHFLFLLRTRKSKRIHLTQGRSENAAICCFVLHLFGPAVFALWLLPVTRGGIIKKKCAILFKLNEFGGRFSMNM